MTERDSDATQMLDVVESERLERVEERLVPRVASAEAGRVTVSKRVVTEPETVRVNVAHDELELERVRVNRPLEPGEQAVSERGGETLVLVVEERVEPRLVPYVVEEIRVRRRLVNEEQEITDTVRRERVEINADGNVLLNDNRG